MGHETNGQKAGMFFMKVNGLILLYVSMVIPILLILFLYFL